MLNYYPRYLGVVGKAFSRVSVCLSLCVCVSVRPIKGKRLKLV